MRRTVAVANALNKCFEQLLKEKEEKVCGAVRLGCSAVLLIEMQWQPKRTVPFFFLNFFGIDFFIYIFLFCIILCIQSFQQYSRIN